MKIKKLAIKSHNSRATPGEILTNVYKYINFHKSKGFFGFVIAKSKEKKLVVLLLSFGLFCSQRFLL